MSCSNPGSTSSTSSSIQAPEITFPRLSIGSGGQRSDARHGAEDRVAGPTTQLRALAPG